MAWGASDLASDVGIHYHSIKTGACLHYYCRSSKLKPDYSQALIFLGKSYAVLDRYDEAIDVLKKAERYEPNNFDIHSFLFIAYSEQGKTELAQQEYAVMEKLDKEKALQFKELKK